MNEDKQLEILYECPRCGNGGNKELDPGIIDCHFCGVVELEFKQGFEAGQQSQRQRDYEEFMGMIEAYPNAMVEQDYARGYKDAIERIKSKLSEWKK